MSLECLDLNVGAFYACSHSTVAFRFCYSQRQSSIYFFSYPTLWNISTQLQLILGYFEVLGKNAQSIEALIMGARLGMRKLHSSSPLFLNTTFVIPAIVMSSSYSKGKCTIQNAKWCPLATHMILPFCGDNIISYISCSYLSDHILTPSLFAFFST